MDISNSEDRLDVRDIIERVEELTDAEGDDADPEELATLTALLNAIKGLGGDVDWNGNWYPSLLIRNDYFTEYCEELVTDIGDMPSNIPGYLVIDWDATADNLRVDYSSVDYDGVEYLCR